MKYLSNVASLEVTTERCTGCGVCLDVCPHGVLEKSADKIAIADRDACMECGACETNCAFGAIRVKKGVGCAAAIIKSMLTGGEPSCGCSSDSSGCC